MKHFRLYILIASIGFASCSDKYSSELGLTPSLTPRYLNVSPTTLLYTATQTSAQNLNIESMETPWKIDNGIEWVSLSQEKGQGVTQVEVKASENINANEARVGVFYVQSDVSDFKFETGVSVTQEEATPYIKVPQTSITLNGATSSASIDVTSNCSYEISGTEEWLSASIKENHITLNASANESTQYRTATILLTHEGSNSAYAKIHVSQAPASINASTETLTFENTAGEAKIDVSSEAKWTASTSDSWITVSPTEGSAGTSSITISIAPNTSVDERTGYVILTIGEEKRIQIPIIQRGIYIKSDKTECNFDGSSGTQDIQISSNTSWEISSLPSWISVDKNSGSGNSLVKVTAEDNPNTTERHGEFVLSQPGLTSSVTIKVHQKGKVFNVATTQLNFTDESGSQDVSIATDGNWQATASTDWISVSSLSGTGNATLSISVTENETNEERNGTVTISMGDATAIIAVVQKGKYFKINNNLLDFTSKGGNLNVSLTTNAAWTARIGDNADWLTVSPSQGSANTEVVITAKDNPSVNDRSANVYFDALGRNVNILVTQKARYLTIDTNELLFYSKGGTSNTITVKTDGEYSIKSNDNWLSIQQAGSTFTVTASENTTTEARIGHITLSLTDLKEGSYSITLTVTQLNYGGTFIRNGFGDDKNYDSSDTSSGSLTITGYGNDSNYDTNSKSTTTLTITGYKTASSWDSSISSSAKVAITGYDTDKSYDSQTSSSGTISKDTYSGDNNWN